MTLAEVCSLCSDTMNSPLSTLCCHSSCHPHCLLQGNIEILSCPICSELQCIGTYSAESIHQIRVLLEAVEAGKLTKDAFDSFMAAYVVWHGTS